MKKFMILLCASFLLMSCSSETKKEKGPIALSAKEVVARIQNKKQNSFLLFLTSDNCYSCDEYMKMIKEVQEEEYFDMYYLNISSNDGSAETNSANEELGMLTGTYSVLPTTYYIYQGTLLPENKKEGYLEKEDFTTWLKSLHILH